MPAPGERVCPQPPGEVVLENKLFYQHFGLKVETRAAPDHLFTQLEFLAWLDHCLVEGNSNTESLVRARREFTERHLAHWLPKAATLAAQVNGGLYAELLSALESEAGRVVTAASDSRQRDRVGLTSRAGICNYPTRAPR